MKEKQRNVGRMILPTPHRNFAQALVPNDVAKSRGGAGEIISPAFFV
jgi:hypothetical protein